MNRYQRYRNLKKVSTVNHAMHQLDLGNTLFYTNSNTDRAVLRNLGGSWGFQYMFGENLNIPGPVKFVRPTASQAIEAFLGFVGRRFLFVEKAQPVTNNIFWTAKSPDDDEFGITITVPKGTRVRIIEV